MNIVTTAAQHHRSRGPASIPFFGYVVHAPRFDAVSFTWAIRRAQDEGVMSAPTDRPGVFTTSRPGSNLTYLVSRTAYSCPAGQRGMACKHRGLAVITLAVIDTRPRGP